jgi:hypothetical protein
MMKMIDFTALPRKNKAYAGANGNKIAVLYQGEQYMLKFPPLPSLNKEMSYANSCISEYIGCHIFESVGIPVQETLLGTFVNKGKEKIVVACKDFTSVGIVLQDFASLKNQVIDSERNGYGTELSDILFSMQEQTAVDSVALSDRFWDMFIVDALIGNWDRHNGNWGFLYDTAHDTMTLAPVFDCGSSLYPQMDLELMEKVLADPKEMDYRIFEIPLSGIKEHDKKIKYFDFISSLKNEDCNRALRRIVPKIDMQAIDCIIEETPYITDLQKTFYKTILAARKERILDYALGLLQAQDPGHERQAYNRSAEQER